MPSDTIKVKVVFFASAKAAAGVDEWEAELPCGVLLRVGSAALSGSGVGAPPLQTFVNVDCTSPAIDCADERCC